MRVAVSQGALPRGEDELLQGLRLSEHRDTHLSELYSKSRKEHNMGNQALNVGIDFSRRRADFGIFGPEGEIIDDHVAVSNSRTGYEQFKARLLEVIQAYELDEIKVTGEATSTYWMPFFMQLVKDQKLNEHGIQTYLLNPKWVSWYKKTFPPDHKTDARDCFYIAERTRTMPHLHEWQMDESWLGLRFLTRLRYHLVQDLTREKNYYQAYLFVLNSAYTQHKPFQQLFGATNSKILADLGQMEAFSQLDTRQLADCLQEMSGNRLRHPLKNAERLKTINAEYFQIDPGLAQVLQRMLNEVLKHIQFIKDQIDTVNQLMQKEAESHPEVAMLRTIPGIGLVFSCGITAELGNINRFLHGQKYDRNKKCYRPKNLRDADASIAKIAGLWWPRSASGSFEAQERKLSKTGNRYLRYYLIEAADRLRQWEPKYQAYYQKKFAETRKFSHKRALVLTARKSIRLYVGLLHRRESYRSKESLKYN